MFACAVSTEAWKREFYRWFRHWRGRGMRGSRRGLKRCWGLDQSERDPCATWFYGLSCKRCSANSWVDRKRSVALLCHALAEPSPAGRLSRENFTLTRAGGAASPDEAR